MTVTTGRAGAQPDGVRRLQQILDYAAQVLGMAEAEAMDLLSAFRSDPRRYARR